MAAVRYSAGWCRPRIVHGKAAEACSVLQDRECIRRKPCCISNDPREGKDDTVPKLFIVNTAALVA
jgi:hypothetical protein